MYGQEVCRGGKGWVGHRDWEVGGADMENGRLGGGWAVKRVARVAALIIRGERCSIRLRTELCSAITSRSRYGMQRGRSIPQIFIARLPFHRAAACRKRLQRGLVEAAICIPYSHNTGRQLRGMKKIVRYL